MEFSLRILIGRWIDELQLDFHKDPVLQREGESVKRNVMITAIIVMALFVVSVSRNQRVQQEMDVEIRNG